MIEIYTDGAYNPALRQGGWAAVITGEGKEQVFSDAVKNSTSNRMEMTAALEGILKTPLDAEAVVYTDSQYLFGTMALGWQRRANRDLWEQLDAAVGQRKVRWEWIRRDNDSPYHNKAHALATEMAGGGKETAGTGAGAGGLSHLDAQGRPRMVDVTDKPDTQRQAVARGVVRMKPATMELIEKGALAKGDALKVAQVAGIMAAKRTPHLIPLCHPLLLGDIKVEFALDRKEGTVEITSTVKSLGKTGVEMEALTSTAVAALTIYDMCKSSDRGMRIDDIHLVRKSGGKSGTIDLEDLSRTGE